MHFHDVGPLMMEGQRKAVWKSGKERKEKIATEGSTVDEHGECNSRHGQNTELTVVGMEGSIVTIRADVKNPLDDNSKLI